MVIMEKIKFSFLIPTYNRVQELEQCLKSLSLIDYPSNNYEIIVIDDGSSKKTENLVNQYQVKQTNLVYLSQKNSGMYPAWNYGASKSKGEILILIDDDCMVSKDILSVLNNCFNENIEAAAFEGQEIPVFYKGIFSILSSYFKTLNKKQIKKRTIYSDLNIKCQLSSNRLAIKRDIFISLGCFSDEFKGLSAGADWDLGFNLLSKGYNVIFTNEFSVFHIQRPTIKDLFLRYYKGSAINVVNFKKYFKGHLILQLPFKKIIKLTTNYRCGYLQISDFEFLLGVILLFFILPLFSIGTFALYSLFLFGKTKNLKLTYLLMLYKFVIGAGTLCGRVVGSLKQKVIYL
jgi:glycosyltransferase involved in cell wall biosynthesis